MTQLSSIPFATHLDPWNVSDLLIYLESQVEVRQQAGSHDRLAEAGTLAVESQLRIVLADDSLIR